MNGHQAKNRAILFVLAVNVLIFGILGMFFLQNASVNRADDKARAAWLEGNGVSCDASVWKNFDGTIAHYDMYEGTQAPDALARALLTGDVVASSDENGTVTWVGNNGTLTWSKQNVVHATLNLTNYAVPTSAQEAQRMTQTFLQRAGWQSDGVTTEEQDSGYHTTVMQVVDRRDVKNAVLTMDYTKDGAVTVSGGWCSGQTGREELHSVDQTSINRLLTALMREKGGMFANISRVYPAYVMLDAQNGRCSLTPFWVFDTDTGSYGVSADGRVLNVNELNMELYAPQGEENPLPFTDEAQDAALNDMQNEETFNTDETDEPAVNEDESDTQPSDMESTDTQQPDTPSTDGRPTDARTSADTQVNEEQSDLQPIDEEELAPETDNSNSEIIDPFTIRPD